MKLRNRIFSSIMALVATMSLVSVNVFAASTTATPSATQVKAGDTFTVEVATVENPGVCAISLLVNTDDNFTLIGAADKGLYPGKNFSSTYTNKDYSLSWFIDDSFSADNTVSGDAATLTFKVNDDATEGVHNIVITSDDNVCMNTNFESVNFGTTTVAVEVIGDAPSIVEATKVVEDKNNKADKAEGEAYTQGFKVTVTGNDQVVTAVPFTLTADGTTKAFAGFTGLEITGATPAVLGLNVKGVPADKTVTAEFSLTIAE